MFNNRCVSSVLFQLFFHITHEGIHDHRPLAVGYYINSARALLLAAEVTRVIFFSSTLFPAHTFLILILQTASYTRMLTDTDHSRVRCSPIDSGMLKRPGTRSNRLGPDPDPADHLKYRPEPYRSRVLHEDLYCRPSQLCQGRQIGVIPCQLNEWSLAQIFNFVNMFSKER